MKKTVNPLSIIKIAVLLLPTIHLGIASFANDFLQDYMHSSSAFKYCWVYITRGHEVFPFTYIYYQLLVIVTFVLALSCIIVSIFGILDKSGSKKIVPVASVVCSVLTLVAWLNIADDQYCVEWVYRVFNSYIHSQGNFYTILFFLSVIFSVLELILPRIKTVAVQSSVTNQPQSPDLNKLIEYKELLDTGIITQAEFDEKKRQILGR